MAQQHGLVPSTYDGREQAFIKHRLLEGYLQKLFLIVGTSVGQGGNIQLCYVDCFAGPWSDESEDLDGTSIGVSLKTMDICRQALGRRGVSARMRALFVEKESTVYARLDTFLRDKTPHGVAATAVQGDFVAVRDEFWYDASAVMTPARSAYVRVLDRKRDRPKYHLVYLTRHPRGIIEFMEISQDIGLIQKQVRAITQDRARAERSRMNDLFGPETRVDPSQGHANPDDVDRFWIDYLRDGMRPIGAEQFADILEQTNWFPGDLQAALVRLIAAGKVVNLDARRARPKEPLHWKKNERLQLVEV